MQIGKQESPWGLKEPYHDKEVVNEASAPTTTIIYMYLNNVLVGTKTISVSGTTTTITVV